MDVVFCIVRRMGSVSVSSCRCCMFVGIMLQFSMLHSTSYLAVCYCWSRMQEATIWKRQPYETGAHME